LAASKRNGSGRAGLRITVSITSRGVPPDSSNSARSAARSAAVLLFGVLFSRPSAEPVAKTDQFRLEKMAYRYQRGPLIAPPLLENCWRRTRLRERPLITPGHDKFYSSVMVRPTATQRASSSAPTCRSTNAGMGFRSSGQNSANEDCS
jgi:hypothetical protein